MGDLLRFRVSPFDGNGRAAGLLVIFRRRASIFGACHRGFFWRFGVKIFSPVEGYYDKTFTLKTSLGQIDLMLKVGMRDEIVPVWFGRSWIHGSLHFCSNGSCHFILTAIDAERYPKMEEESVTALSPYQTADVGFYDPDN